MNTVEIDGSKINSWHDFHTHFKESMGFFDGYGMNLDAWIDCMTDIDLGENALSKITVPKGETLYLKILNTLQFSETHSEILQQFVLLTSSVNLRFKEFNHETRIALLFF
jgi:hypothetical protein